MIQINQLSFGYNKDRMIISDLNMFVPKGSIYGFIGINGAGKSTTIRLLLNLLKANKGIVLINGKNIQEADLKKIGFLIDNPVFYDHLSCYQNLQLLKNYYPNINENDIAEILSIVGMEKSKNYLHKNCSNGMKQRLGIAKAIIHRPELIILDEPLNGLDPDWVINIRNLLIDINKNYGTTIFFTNHILSEVEKIATHIGILKAGHLIIESPIKDILNKTLQKELLVYFDSTEQISDNFFDIPYKKIDEHQLLFKISDEHTLNIILSKLAEKKINIKNIEVKGNDLESVFLNLLN